jgi:hypothetical protein
MLCCTRGRYSGYKRLKRGVARQVGKKIIDLQVPQGEGEIGAGKFTD